VQGRQFIVALESTDTYGDTLRQALQQAGLLLYRVSPRGRLRRDIRRRPSQHDGKDASIVGELAAHRGCGSWPLARPNKMEQDLAYQVDWQGG
jgi:hypothetical protein